MVESVTQPMKGLTQSTGAFALGCALAPAAKTVSERNWERSFFVIRRLSRPDKSSHPSDGLHELVHLCFLLLDGFDQFELGAAAVEVVPLAVHLEVGVARQEVREEANADFKG